PTLDGLVPSECGEPKRELALPEREPGIVCGSDRSPVIAASEATVRRYIEPADVECNRRLCNPESPCDLPLAQPLLEQAPHPLSHHARRKPWPWVSAPLFHSERMFAGWSDGNTWKPRTPKRRKSPERAPPSADLNHDSRAPRMGIH